MNELLEEDQKVEHVLDNSNGAGTRCKDEINQKLRYEIRKAGCVELRLYKMKVMSSRRKGRQMEYGYSHLHSMFVPRD